MTVLQGSTAFKTKSWTAALALLAVGAADAKQLMVASLADLSLEELSRVEITSVSKRPERLSDAPASVFVITSDNIRRSGVTTLPDALRLAPNLQVFQAQAGGYVVTARGSTVSGTTVGNKMLVLIDGRSVYSPLFAGVNWHVQHVMLEDVDRIEVISGPGGVLWGVNAVNGVINIITRRAKDTQGVLVAAGTGSAGTDASVRYGGDLGDAGHYRVYAKRANVRSTETRTGANKHDDYYITQVGMRADWSQGENNFALIANAYDGSLGQPEPGTLSLGGVPQALDDIPVRGINILARWDRALTGGGQLEAQVYYDRSTQDVVPSFAQDLDIFDLQFQHRFAPIGAHALTWGAQYRYAIDRISNGEVFQFRPDDVNQRWYSLFVQDEIGLSDTLRLTLGARLEHNDYTDWEFLPSARLAWKFAPEHLLWAAISRAVRAPSRIDRDLFAIHPALPQPVLRGGEDMRSEIAEVYEVGYRGNIGANFLYSVTVFHTNYDDLRTQEDNVSDPLAPFAVFGSGMEGTTDGVEIWGTYEVSPQWRLSAGFTYLNVERELKRGSRDQNTVNIEEGASPERMWLLRSSINLPYQMELDTTLRHVSALDTGDVPSYLAVDIRLGWRPDNKTEVSVTGINLFGGSHAEFGGAATRSEFDSGVYFKVVTQF